MSAPLSKFSEEEAAVLRAATEEYGAVIYEKLAQSLRNRDGSGVAFWNREKDNLKRALLKLGFTA
jgi:hypothetical protein